MQYQLNYRKAAGSKHSFAMFLFAEKLLVRESQRQRERERAVNAVKVA